MRIFHIATAADWAEAQRTGSYTTSTRGVTLEQEGFIHAARKEQVQPVWRRYYADADEPLVLLTIDTDKLASRWQEDPVGDDTYPHVYGPIDTPAVVRAQPLDRRGGTGSFLTTFTREMGVRAGLAILAMLLAGAGATVGERTSSEWGPFAGGVTGLLLGLGLMGLVLRRRG